MISKALKGLSGKDLDKPDKKPTTFIGKTCKKVADMFGEYVYYPMYYFFSRTYERVFRSWAFAKHGYMHYDFESAYLYDLMAFKLKRVYKCLKNGNAVQEYKNMSALAEAITICERLFKGTYDEKYYKLHDKKWGKLCSKTIPEYDEKGKIKHYRWESWRSKTKTAEQKKKERKDLRKIWVNEEEDRRADLDRLNEILKNHEPTWWD